MVHAGIDFGARFAGTTAICWNEADKLHVRCCPKGTDADEWLLLQVAETGAVSFFIDAPLSLPGAYLGRGTDYSYRQADRETGAMSPMFLGGLTARAIQFAQRLYEMGYTVMEVYPAALVRLLPPLKEAYKKKDKSSLGGFIEVLDTHLPHIRSGSVYSYHEADSLLCWLSGNRYLSGAAVSYGDDTEGKIWV